MRQGTVHVVIAGGGVAAVESVLALTELVPHRVELTLLSPQLEFLYQPVTVGEAFARSEARTYSLRELLASRGGGELIWDSLAEVRPDERLVITGEGDPIPYDLLIMAVGAVRQETLHGALTFRGRADVPAMRELLDELLDGRAHSAAFALPSEHVWPLPLYELALMTAEQLRYRTAESELWLITPEEEPLALFGPAAAAAVRKMLRTHGVKLRTSAMPAEIQGRRLALRGGASVFADRVITVPELVGPAIPGLPHDEHGFVPVDAHSRVKGLDGVYAAGDATAFPVKQGGLAAQQADAAAEHIAARLGLPIEPNAFHPVLRGFLMTDGGPLYLRCEPQRLARHASVAVEEARQHRSGSQISRASDQPLWWPPAKIAGRYLGPFLATARPSSLATAPLVDRVAAPRCADPEPEYEDALELTLLLADADARWGDYGAALSALDSAQSLYGSLPAEYEAKRDAWTLAARSS